MQSETIAQIGGSDVAELFDSGLSAVMAVLRSEAQVNLIEGILRDAAHANDPSRLKPLRERFIAAKSSLLENIAIAAGSEAKQLGTLPGELPQLSEVAGNTLDLPHAGFAAVSVAEGSR